MKATIYISGKIGKETTLVDVIRQYKSFEEPTEVYAIIDSIGGSVEEGEAIYDYLNNLKAEHPVNTYAKKAYSQAAKIFAVGDEREVDDVEKSLMIHFAWGKAEGRAEDFEAVAEYLRGLETEFAEFYAEFLNIDEETISTLLNNETFISGQDALKFGFATKVKVAAEAVAEYSVQNSNTNKMTDKKKEKSKGQALLEAMAAFVGIDYKTGQPVEVNAEMTLQDSSGTEIVFPDLESGDTPKVGDKATIDGSPVPDGDYIMPSLEDSTVVFVDGAISEIKPKEDEGGEGDEGAQASEKGKGKKKPVEANAEEVQQISVWTMEVLNTTFAVGDVVKYMDWDDNEQTVGSGEFQLSDGRRVVTDATGVIVTIKEAATQKEVEVDTEASFKELLEKVTEKVAVKVKADVTAEFQTKLTEKENEIKDLKKKVGSKEFNAQEKDNDGKENKQSGKSQASVLLQRTKKQ